MAYPRAGRPDVVVVGASAGGVEALRRFLGALPADLDATVLVALHLARGTPSLLAGVLDRASGLQVRAASTSMPLEPGVAYVAQPDSHLVVLPDRVARGTGPRENGHRPSTDVLLRSAAVSHGPRAVGLVLTGMLDDGSAGLRAVARYGGTALVQDPREADFPAMPQNALAAVPTATVAPLDELARQVVRLVSGTTGPLGPRPEVPAAARERDEAEVRAALGEASALPIGAPSPYSCPDCGGVLNGIDDSGLLRFRCRVGHAWSAEGLLDVQGETVERALWTALRALEERRQIADRLAEQADGGGREWSRSQFRTRAQEAESSARVLRQLLAQERPDSPDEQPRAADGEGLDAGPAGPA